MFIDDPFVLRTCSVFWGLSLLVVATMEWPRFKREFDNLDRLMFGVAGIVIVALSTLLHSELTWWNIAGAIILSGLIGRGALFGTVLPIGLAVASLSAVGLAYSVTRYINVPEWGFRLIAAVILALLFHFLFLLRRKGSK